MTVDSKAIDHLLNRGTAEIIVRSEFTRLINSSTPLRLKMGFDPSAPDIHVGHAVGLRKLRQLQELGHKVVLIVGDWTAQIGDPSGKSQTRPMLTSEEVSQNAETYLTQFFKIVDRQRTEVRWQSEWFGSFSLTDVINITSRFTVAQLIAREDFTTRFKANHPIAMTELLYPLLQAYDSVAIESDVEFGGTDQKFNLLIGRDLQEMTGQRPQQIFLVPLLPGTDGKQKMSKSLGNHIGVTESPNDIYGKTMSLPDFISEDIDQSTKPNSDFHKSLILLYMETLTDIPDKELVEMKTSLETNTVNPMELKKLLAKELVQTYHGTTAARNAEQHFEHTIQRRKTPKEMDTYSLSSSLDTSSKRLSHVLVESGLAESASQARRLINQGAITIDEKITKNNLPADVIDDGSIIKIGKRRFLKIERDQKE